MQRPDYISSLLYNSLCHDLGLTCCLKSSRFDPFPYGLPLYSEFLGVRDYARRALLCSVFKKSEIESAPDAEAQTKEAFLEANRFCGLQTLDQFRKLECSPAVGYSIATAREILYQWFSQKEGSIDPAITMAGIEMSARFGPGASVKHGSRPTTLYFKCGDAPMSAGSEFVRSWYESSVSRIPLCEAAEMARKARHGDILVHNCGNATFVPKSYSKRRLVVTEPSLNTYFQLGLGKEMERVLRKHTGISFDTQPGLNAELARLGSLNGSYATMDLTQCSDYISRALVEFIFPPTIVRWVNILRTKSTCFGPTEVVDLNMVSTMGNGFTFPLQTILLVACVLGVYDTLGIRTYDGENRTYGVFGDDIVVKEEAYHLLSKVLQSLGLKVNQDKSYFSGSFRESCGADYYLGTNVRGVYLKRYSSDQDLFSCFNRLSLWSATHDIKIDRTLSAILSLIEGPKPMVPPDESVTAGIIIPEFPFRDSDGSFEYYPYRPIPHSLNFEPWELWETSDPLQAAVLSSKKKFSRWLSDLNRYCGGSLNEPAVLKVLLAGGLRRSKMFIRSDNIKYRQIVAKSPRWGYSPLEAFPLRGTPVFERLDLTVKHALGIQSQIDLE